MNKIATVLVLLCLLFTGCGGAKKKKGEAAKTKRDEPLANQGTDQDFNAFIGRLR